MMVDTPKIPVLPWSHSSMAGSPGKTLSPHIPKVIQSASTSRHLRWAYQDYAGEETPWTLRDPVTGQAHGPCCAFCKVCYSWHDSTGPLFLQCSWHSVKFVVRVIATAVREAEIPKARRFPLSLFCGLVDLRSRCFRKSSPRWPWTRIGLRVVTNQGAPTSKGG